LRVKSQSFERGLAVACKEVAEIRAAFWLSTLNSHLPTRPPQPPSRRLTVSVLHV
jgi:hypothetical protein